MSTDIALFTEEILEVTPRYNNAFGDGFLGAGSQPLTATSSSTDVANVLRAATIKFAQAYTYAGTPPEQLLELAKAVEGALMVVQTLGMLSNQKVNHLIETLHTLMEAKHGTEHN